MAQQIVIGLFEPRTEIARVTEALVRHGFEPSAVSAIHGRQETQPLPANADSNLTTLFEGRVPGPEIEYFSEGLRRGGVVVTVAVSSRTGANEAAEILDRYGAIDIDARVAEWRSAGWQTEVAQSGASEASSEALSRALDADHQSGRIRGSRVFIW